MHEILRHHPKLVTRRSVIDYFSDLHARIPSPHARWNESVSRSTPSHYRHQGVITLPHLVPELRLLLNLPWTWQLETSIPISHYFTDFDLTHVFYCRGMRLLIELSRRRCFLGDRRLLWPLDFGQNYSVAIVHPSMKRIYPDYHFHENLPLFRSIPGPPSK